MCEVGSGVEMSIFKIKLLPEEQENLNPIHCHPYSSVGNILHLARLKYWK